MKASKEIQNRGTDTQQAKTRMAYEYRKQISKINTTTTHVLRGSFPASANWSQTYPKVPESEVVAPFFKEPLQRGSGFANFRVPLVVLETVAEDELSVLEELVNTVVFSTLDFASNGL